MSRLFLPALLGFTLVLCACPSDPGDDDDVTAGDDDDAADLPIVPDPGEEQADWGWDVIDVCCGTPETAYPVGIVVTSPGYIQGAIDDDLSFFYVFRSGAALTDFTFPNFFEEVHLHDGDGLRFGDLVDPSDVQKFEVTWEVEPDHVYVVEIVSDFSGFF